MQGDGVGEYLGLDCLHYLFEDSGKVLSDLPNQPLFAGLALDVHRVDQISDGQQFECFVLSNHRTVHLLHDDLIDLRNIHKRTHLLVNFSRFFPIPRIPQLLQLQCLVRQDHDLIRWLLTEHFPRVQHKRLPVLLVNSDFLFPKPVFYLPELSHHRLFCLTINFNRICYFAVLKWL